MIARSIGVHKSAASREIRRNSTPNGKYVWAKAHVMAESRQHHIPGNRRLDEVQEWRVIGLKKWTMVSPADIRPFENGGHNRLP